MDIKRLIIGTVSGAIALYLTGMLIWEVLFAEFFDANTGSAAGVDREAPILWAVILANILYALLLTMVLEFRGTSRSLMDAVVVSAIVGALVRGTADFIWYGFTHVNNLTATIADTVLEGIHAGISGGVIAAVLKKLTVGSSQPVWIEAPQNPRLRND